MSGRQQGSVVSERVTCPSFEPSGPGVQPPRASGERGRRKEKQLLAFRVTPRVLAVAEMNSPSESLSLVVSGEWRTKIGWREHTVPEINWKSRDASGKEESHSTALSPFSEFESREYLVFMCVWIHSV